MIIETKFNINDEVDVSAAWDSYISEFNPWKIINIYIQVDNEKYHTIYTLKSPKKGGTYQTTEFGLVKHVPDPITFREFLLSIKLDLRFGQIFVLWCDDKEKPIFVSQERSWPPTQKWLRKHPEHGNLKGYQITKIFPYLDLPFISYFKANE